jgi:hypothetical protein
VRIHVKNAAAAGRTLEELFAAAMK